MKLFLIMFVIGSFQPLFSDSKTLIAQKAAIKKEHNEGYKAVMKIVNNYSKSINSSQGIKLRGYGLHYAGKNKIYDGKIHEVDLMYSIDKRLQYKPARDLFYSIVDGLLAKINSDEKVKKYFFKFPIGYEDLHFSLAFDYDSKGTLKKDDVDSIGILDNEIFYFIATKDGEVKNPKMNQVVPDVYIMEESDASTRAIVRKLPEQPE